jgi:chromosome segregation ATPase
LENLQVKKAADTLQAARNVELEALVKSQADKIAELEAFYADLKREKENIMAGYQRLSDEHNAITEKAKQEAEAHTTEVARIQGELNEETQGYTDYCQSVCIAASASFMRWWHRHLPKL